MITLTLQVWYGEEPNPSSKTLNIQVTKPNSYQMLLSLLDEGILRKLEKVIKANTTKDQLNYICIEMDNDGVNSGIILDRKQLFKTGEFRLPLDEIRRLY